MLGISLCRKTSPLSDSQRTPAIRAVARPCGLAQAGFVEPARSDLPDGLRSDFPVQPPLQKYSAFPKTQITSISTAVPSQERGDTRSSRTRDGMRWTRAVSLTNDTESGRRNRVVLTPRCWRQVGGGNFASDGGKKADHRGDHV